MTALLIFFGGVLTAVVFGGMAGVLLDKDPPSGFLTGVCVTAFAGAVLSASVGVLAALAGLCALLFGGVP